VGNNMVTIGCGTVDVRFGSRTTTATAPNLFYSFGSAAIANSHLVGVCAMPLYSIHCSQGFHDREVAHPNEAGARIVQVDSHPQCDRQNGSINGVEYRKPAAHATIAVSDHTNADCRRPQKLRHDRNRQMSSCHSKVRRMQINDLVDRRQNHSHQWRVVLSGLDR
jgi:hypothetical protein